MHKIISLRDGNLAIRHEPLKVIKKDKYDELYFKTRQGIPLMFCAIPEDSRYLIEPLPNHIVEKIIKCENCGCSVLPDDIMTDNEGLKFCSFECAPHIEDAKLAEDARELREEKQ